MLRRSIAVLFALVIAGAALAHPGAGIAVGADGRVYFVDTGGGLFSLDRNGRVTRHPGPAFHWFAFDPARRFRQTSFPYISGAEFRSSDVFMLSSDFPVAIGTDAIFYFPEGSRERGVRIVGIAPNGTRTVRATLPAIRNFQQRAASGGCDVHRPVGHHRETAQVRTLDRHARNRGAVTPILRTQAPWSPTAVAVSNGEVYVLEYSHTATDNRVEWFPRVRKIARDGKVTLVGRTPRR